MLTPYVIRTLTLPSGRIRAWATVDGRRRQGTYGPPPKGCRLPHAWAADQHGRILGLAADSSPLWGAARLPVVAFQAWA
jgi:hypothetical protein